MPSARAVEAVVFDLDDTLVDWRTSVLRAATEAAGPDVAERLVEWAESNVWRRRDGIVVARDTWKLVEYAEITWAAALPDLDEADLALAIKRFRADLWIAFFPDVVPALDDLVQTHRLGVLSNNPYLELEVARLRLHDWFEVAVSLPREEMKPDRRAFDRTLAALGTQATRTVYVGDSIAADVEGALGAGWVAVWLDRHHDGWTAPPAVHRIRSMTELGPLLDSLSPPVERP